MESKLDGIGPVGGPKVTETSILGFPPSSCATLTKFRPNPTNERHVRRERSGMFCGRMGSSRRRQDAAAIDKHSRPFPGIYDEMHMHIHMRMHHVALPNAPLIYITFRYTMLHQTRNHYNTEMYNTLHYTHYTQCTQHIKNMHRKHYVTRMCYKRIRYALQPKCYAISQATSTLHRIHTSHNQHT